MREELRRKIVTIITTITIDNVMEMIRGGDPSFYMF